MHLAGQGGFIAGAAQVMGKGWNAGGKFRRIVIDPGAAGQQPGHERRPRGRAQGTGAIGVGEIDALAVEPPQMRHVQKFSRSAVTEQGSVALVDHEDQKIRLSAHNTRPPGHDFIARFFGLIIGHLGGKSIGPAPETPWRLQAA